MSGQLPGRLRRALRPGPRRRRRPRKRPRRVRMPRPGCSAGPPAARSPLSPRPRQLQRTNPRTGGPHRLPDPSRPRTRRSPCSEGSGTAPGNAMRPASGRPGGAHWAVSDLPRPGGDLGRGHVRGQHARHRHPRLRPRRHPLNLDPGQDEEQRLVACAIPEGRGRVQRRSRGDLFLDLRGPGRRAPGLLHRPEVVGAQRHLARPHRIPRPLRARARPPARKHTSWNPYPPGRRMAQSLGRSRDISQWNPLTTGAASPSRQLG
jgi:hypothetical protein